MKQNLSPRINRLESNLVIDGGMELWPEGTSRSVANNTSAYGGVLFQYNNISSGVTMTNSRQSSTPSGTNLIYSNQVSKTAAGTLAAGTRQIMHYHVEGYDLNRIYNNEWSLIFWVKSSVASNRSCSVRNASFSHSYVQQYNIASANTWELKVLSFPAISSCPGTVERTNGAGAVIGWDIVTGTTYQTSSLNQWVAGNFSSGIGEDTSWLTGTTHDFNITGVMVLPGDWSALTAAGYNFVRAGKNFQDELAMSQRYYEKSYDLDVTPGTPAATAGTLFVISISTVSGNAVVQVHYKTSKRATPTVTFYNTVTGAVGTFDRGGTPVSFAISAGSNGVSGFNVANTAITNAVNGHSGQWVSDARF
jgi:hypothetical protein